MRGVCEGCGDTAPRLKRYVDDGRRIDLMLCLKCWAEAAETPTDTCGRCGETADLLTRTMVVAGFSLTVALCRECWRHADQENWAARRRTH